MFSPSAKGHYLRTPSFWSPSLPWVSPPWACVDHARHAHSWYLCLPPLQSQSFPQATGAGAIRITCKMYLVESQEHSA